MSIRLKLPVTVGLIGMALVIWPGSAPAAVTFGSDLSQIPGSNCVDCAALTLKTSSGSELTGSPVNGTLISARIKTRLEAATGSFRVLRPAGSLADPLNLNFLNVGEAPVSVTADASPAGHVTEVQTSLPIAMGDRLAVSFPNQDLHYLVNSPNALCAYRPEGPPQPVGSNAAYSADGCGIYEVLIAGTVDPDHSVTLGKATNLKSGKATLPITLPNSGVVSVTGGGAGAAGAAKSRSAIKPAGATATAAGTVTLLLKPSKAGQRILSRTHKLKTTITVSFTPTGGSTGTRVSAIKLRRKR